MFVLFFSVDDKYAYSFGKDVERMMFDTSRKKIWRILQSNEDYSLCQSYPRHHIVPASINDEQIKSVAGFRSGNRIPSVVWRYVDGWMENRLIDWWAGVRLAMGGQQIDRQVLGWLWVVSRLIDWWAGVRLASYGWTAD